MCSWGSLALLKGYIWLMLGGFWDGNSQTPSMGFPWAFHGKAGKMRKTEAGELASMAEAAENRGDLCSPAPHSSPNQRVRGGWATRLTWVSRYFSFSHKLGYKLVVGLSPVSGTPNLFGAPSAGAYFVVVI